MTTLALPARFAQHELRLAWRDLMSILTAGKRGRERAVIVIVAIAALLMHGLAYAVVAPYAGLASFDRETLIVVTGVALLAWTLMMSQAMESVTRAFFSRSDLDLILSSPVSPRAIFALRIGAITLTTMAMAMILVAPFVDVAIVLGGARWFAAYAVVAGLAAAAVAIALGTTMGLFALVGAKRTRLMSQILAAIVGAAFAIGVQLVSIVSYGNLSRVAAFHSEIVRSIAPAIESPLWLPAKAAMGDIGALLVVISLGVASLVLVTGLSAGRFGHYVTAAAGLSQAEIRHRPRRSIFRTASAVATLRRKELALLARDPWLASQTLMQLLYLLPPALLLWRSYQTEAGSLVILAPVIVMAAGQLAGGLAWLAISGEDAPDLITTSPIARGIALRAKIEAVILAVAMPVSPFVVAIAFVSPYIAAVTAVGVVAATASSTAIQIFFRMQARRIFFRRRQTSSRTATFAEALSSINWAATAALAAAGTWLAIPFALVSLGILYGAWLISPRSADAAQG